MMYDNFSKDAQRVMELAEQEARRLRSAHIRPEHILLGLGLLKDESREDDNVLLVLDVDFRKIRLEVEKLTEEGVSCNSNKMPTEESFKVIRIAEQNALESRRTVVEAEDLLCGLLDEPESEADASIAYKVLTEFGFNLGRVKHAIIAVQQIIVMLTDQYHSWEYMAALCIGDEASLLN